MPCDVGEETGRSLAPKSSRATTMPSPGDAARYGVAIPISLKRGQPCRWREPPSLSAARRSGRGPHSRRRRPVAWRRRTPTRWRSLTPSSRVTSPPAIAAIRPATAATVSSRPSMRRRQTATLRSRKVTSSAAIGSRLSRSGVRRGECRRRLVVGGNHRRFGSGARQHLEIGRNDDAERAKRAEVEPRHVVTGDILDDHAAGFGDGAARVRDRDSDQEISQGAGAVAKWSPATGGDQPADRRVRPAGRIERQALPMLGQDRLNVAEPGTGADREDEIRRLVVDDARQAFGREDAVDSLGRISQVQRGAAADRGDRLPDESAASARTSAASWRIVRDDDLGGERPSIDRRRVPTFRLDSKGHGCRASGPSPACAGRGPLRTCSPWGRPSPG